MNEKIVGKALKIPVAQVKQYEPGLNYSKENGYSNMLSLVDSSTTERFTGEFCTVEVGIVVRTKSSNKVFAVKEGNRIGILMTKPLLVEHDHKLGDLLLSQFRHLLHENFYSNFVKMMPRAVLSPMGIVRSFNILIITSILNIEDTDELPMYANAMNYSPMALEELIAQRNIINYPDVHMIHKLPFVRGLKDAVNPEQ